MKMFRRKWQRRILRASVVTGYFLKTQVIKGHPFPLVLRFISLGLEQLLKLLLVIVGLNRSDDVVYLRYLSFEILTFT